MPILRASLAREPRESERGNGARASERIGACAAAQLPAYQVVVVGARCAGAATAMLLARRGCRVLVVDRGRYGTDTLSTHALMRGAVVQLHRWGVLPDVIASGTPPVRCATFFYGDKPVPIPIAARHGIDALYAPRRGVLDRLLVDAASDAGADIVFGVRLRELTRSETGRVTGVVLEDEAGDIQRVPSRMVVGADGLRSAVARTMRATIYREGRHATGTMYGHFSGLDVRGYEWYFVRGLSAGAIPTNDGQTCVFVSVPASEFTQRFAHQPEAGFLEALSQVAPALASKVQEGPRESFPGKGQLWLSLAGVRTPLRGFPGHTGFLRQAHGPGWALVGDAGYFKDPLTSHGITDALRDAELLAEAIEDGSPAAMAGYQEERDSASAALFEATDEIASLAWDLDEVRRLHERLAKAMSNELKGIVRLSGRRQLSPLSSWGAVEPSGQLHGPRSSW